MVVVPNQLHGKCCYGTCKYINELLQRSGHENDPAKQRDVVAEPVEPGVRVAHGEIDIDPAEQVIDRPIESRHRSRFRSDWDATRRLRSRSRSIDPG